MYYWYERDNKIEKPSVNFQCPFSVALSLRPMNIEVAYITI